MEKGSHLSELLCEPVDLGAAPVVLLEGAAGERAGRAAAHEAEPVEQQRLTELFAAEGPESAASSTERDSQGRAVLREESVGSNYNLQDGQMSIQRSQNHERGIMIIF